MSDKNFDIIIYSLTRWDYPMVGSSMAFAKEYSINHRVFFIDRPYSIKDLFTNFRSYDLKKRLKAILFRKNPYIKVETGYSSFIVAIPGISLPLNFLPKGFIFNFFNIYNRWVVKSCIKKLIKTYSIKNYIYFNHFNPIILPVLRYIKPLPLANIYYITNDISHAKYISRHGVDAEEKALKRADLIFVNSKFQFKKLISQQSNVHYIPNAVDYELFEAAEKSGLEKPFDLANIGDTKVIMFCGYLSSVRIDYPLLKMVCETYHQYLVIIVGTYEESDLIKYNLEQINNLLILGNRRYESIPSYINAAHVTIIPYLRNDLNKSVYPLKLNEYLAMGKPVVTTNFSSDLEGFSDIIYISNSYDSFIDNIQYAIEADNDNLKEARKDIAAKNTWKKRVQHMEDIFINHLSQKNS